MKKLIFIASIVCLFLNYGCVSVEKVYENAKLKNDIAVYNSFLNKYPKSIYKDEITKLRDEKNKENERKAIDALKIVNCPYLFNEFITQHSGSVYIEECKQLLQKSKDEYKAQVESNFSKLKKGMTLDEVKKIIPFDCAYRTGSYSNTSTKDGVTTSSKTDSYSPNDFCSLTFFNDKLESWSKY